MEVKAKLNQLRMAPRKVRLVSNLISGMSVEDAKIQLEFLTKKASDPVLKLLNSAIANAKHNHKLKESDLYVSKILVNGGPMMKRWFPRAMGRAFEIKKRTCSVVLVLSDENRDEQSKKTRKKKTETQVESAESVKKEKNHAHNHKEEDKKELEKKQDKHKKESKKATVKKNKNSEN